jgi:hypothetical protein
MNKKDILTKLKKKGLISEEDYGALLKEIELKQNEIISGIKKNISGDFINKK